MHFNLPDQLALEVAGYDQTRKKLAAAMAAEDAKEEEAFRRSLVVVPRTCFPKHVI